MAKYLELMLEKRRLVFHHILFGQMDFGNLTLNFPSPQLFNLD
jgi:hypothetical protein